METDYDDYELVLLLAGAGSCSLDSSPGKNWVENSGGLPTYICQIAKKVMRSGKSKSSAIAIAVSQVKKWAAGGDKVDADTKAKAAKAVAEWTALKAKNKAKQVVKAARHDLSDYLELSNVSSFNTDIVRNAWNELERQRRKEARDQAKASGNTTFDEYEAVPYTYIRELWTDHILLENEGRRNSYIKVPYTVDSVTGVSFGEGVPVEMQFVEVDQELTPEEIDLLGDLVKFSSPLDRVIALANTRGK